MVTTGLNGQQTDELAERVGFEPTVEFPLHTLSKRAPSTTRTSLRFRINNLRAARRQFIARRRRMHASSTSPLNPTAYGLRTATVRRNCVRPRNLLRSLTDADSAREAGAVLHWSDRSDSGTGMGCLR